MPSVVNSENIEVEQFENHVAKETKTISKLLKRKSISKNFKIWLQTSKTLIKEEHKSFLHKKMYSPADFICFIDEIEEKYKELSSTRVELEKVQGISNFDMEYGKDIIYVYTHLDKKPHTTIIDRGEKVWLEIYLRKKLEKEDRLESIKCAFDFSKRFDRNIFTKEDYYSNRKFQNEWTILLRLLKKEGTIEYSAGIITQIQDQSSESI